MTTTKDWAEAKYFLYLSHTEDDETCIIPFNTIEEIEEHLKVGHDEDGWIDNYIYRIIEGKCLRFTPHITHNVKITVSDKGLMDI